MSLPRDFCTTKNLKLDTSIDLEVSTFAHDIMESILTPLEAKNIHNSGIYVYSIKEGKVITYIGNRENTKDNALDMITARRSVGSVLKPFIYRMSFEKGTDGESYILDDTRVYATENPTKNYIPENYIPKSYGPIRLREAL